MERYLDRVPMPRTITELRHAEYNFHCAFVNVPGAVVEASLMRWNASQRAPWPRAELSAVVARTRVYLRRRAPFRRLNMDYYPKTAKEAEELMAAGVHPTKIRTPDGQINNCAMAHGLPESDCQVCDGTCPDRSRFVAELPRPPSPEDLEITRQTLESPSLCSAPQVSFGRCYPLPEYEPPVSPVEFVKVGDSEPVRVSSAPEPSPLVAGVKFVKVAEAPLVGGGKVQFGSLRPRPDIDHQQASDLLAAGVAIEGRKGIGGDGIWQTVLPGRPVASGWEYRRKAEPKGPQSELSRARQLLTELELAVRRFLLHGTWVTRDELGNAQANACRYLYPPTLDEPE
jgi:hypothetical protein